MLTAASPADPVPADSKVEAVTVYRGQAMVTRLVTLPPATGELQIVVGDLPAAVIGSSLAASADGTDGVTIRSVRFRAEPVSDAPRPEVADLETQLKDVQHDLFAIEQKMALLKQQHAYLNKLEAFVAPTANVEMAKGVLNPQMLAELTEMAFERRGQLIDRHVALTAETRELTEHRDLLVRKLTELAQDAPDAIREAVVFVGKDTPGPAAIRLRYLVNEANWTPAYNLHLAEGNQSVEAAYLADARQMSGEDWDDVTLTLSTATPHLNARNPILGPMWVTLSFVQGEQQDRMAIGGEQYFKGKEALQQVQASNRAEWAVQANQPQAQAAVNWAMNVEAAKGQRLELGVSPEAVRRYRERVRQMEEGLAVSYTFDGRMHLASRADRQLVEIARLDVEAETHYGATPLLTSYVYHLAELTNTSALPLLNGPYSAYVGQEFVGKGQLPVVARGQKVVVGFGIDTQLRCTRELVEKSDEISWGQRVQTFHYQLRLESFKDRPVDVRLYDRIPVSKTDDIQIRLVKTSDALSTDELYLRFFEPKGILRWDIHLVAGASGASARDVTYVSETKFAKDKHVGAEATELLEEMKADYHRMLMN